MLAMKRMLILFAIFVILVILPGMRWSNGTVDPILAAGLQKFKERVSAPAFTLQALDGKNLRLEDFTGKIVLLDFWATW